jgi:glutamyl-tRNA reductase
VLFRELINHLIPNMVSPSDRVVIIGAGVFGLSLAYQLASEGNQNVMVMDRHVPPVCTSSVLLCTELRRPIDTARSLMVQASISHG